MKVFISTTTFGKYNKEPLRLLKNAKVNYALNPYNRRLTEEEILNILKNNSYSGLIAGTEPITKKVLENAKFLKVISRLGVGLDNIDLGAAKKLKIKIYKTSNVLTDSVAELTIGLILSCLRKIAKMDKNMRKKIWLKEVGSLFKGKTIGVIGFGKIGRRVAQLSSDFGAKIIFYDVKEKKSSIAEQVSLNTLLKKSDIISLHSSSKDKLISKKEILKTKKEVIIINTSRGSVISEEELYRGLRSQRIAFAALDVFEKEPYNGKLTRLDNVVLTPHIGSYAKEARIEMEIEAIRNLIEGFKK